MAAGSRSLVLGALYARVKITADFDVLPAHMLAALEGAQL
jgi:hypothetical protein